MAASPWMATCLVSVAVLSPACTRARPSEPWSYDRNVGLAVSRQDRHCLTVANEALTPGTRAHVVEMTAQRELQAVITSSQPACVDPANSDPAIRGYALRYDGEPPSGPLLGIAIVGSSAQLRRTNDVITADLDDDGHEEFFRSCTSVEGVHFTIWSYAPLSGRRRWHRYHYVGYDMTPTCTPEEVR